MSRWRFLLDRRWTVLISVAAGATVLLLAIGVYTMAARAAEANEQSAGLYLADETIRTIEIADARARQLVMLALLERDGIETAAAQSESRAEFDSAIADARSGIEALQIVGIIDDDAALDALTQASIGLEGVDARLDDSRDISALTTVRLEVLTPLSDASSEVATDRDRLLDALDSTAGTLRSVATFVGFIVAFVVPTVAVVVHRVATRPGRDEAVLRAGVGALEDKLTDLTRGTEDLVQHRIVEPIHEATAGRDPRTVHPGIRAAEAGAERVLLLLRVGNGSLEVAPTAVDLGRLLEDIATELELPLRNLMAQSVPADTDPELLTWCLDELIQNAQRHGQSPQLDLSPAAEGIRIRVVDRGPGLPNDVIGLVFGRRETDAKRRARRGESATGLLLVSAIVQRLGGSLQYEREADETRFSIVQPLHRAAGSATPERAGAEPRLPT